MSDTINRRPATLRNYEILSISHDPYAFLLKNNYMEFFQFYADLLVFSILDTVMLLLLIGLQMAWMSTPNHQPSKPCYVWFRKLHPELNQEYITIN